MVTIRNDIESNCIGNGSPGLVDGVKNVNHLANGSPRPTVAEIKPKAFNRRCVSFLALIVCVAICFGVGMLFLYGHLVDRLNESTSQGILLYDEHKEPIMLPPKSAMSTTTVSSNPALAEEEKEAEQQLVTDDGDSSPTLWIDFSSGSKENGHSAEQSEKINAERVNVIAQYGNGGSVTPHEGSFDDEQDEDAGSGGDGTNGKGVRSDAERF